MKKQREDGGGGGGALGERTEQIWKVKSFMGAVERWRGEKGMEKSVI